VDLNANNAGSALSCAQWQEPDKLSGKAPRDLWRELDRDLWLAKAETAEGSLDPRGKSLVVKGMSRIRKNYVHDGASGGGGSDTLVPLSAAKWPAALLRPLPTAEIGDVEVSWHPPKRQPIAWNE
jgi:hypothetical protein